MTFAGNSRRREPFRPARGSSQTVTIGLIVMVLTPIPLPLAGCSSSVDALWRVDAAVGPPVGIAPVPTPLQAAFQRNELTAFIHLGLETFDGTEQGDSAKDSAALFNPTNLDATQWVAALKEAGFRQAMLSTKHGTGFCLWPSAYTDYSVKNSPWKNGQGDVVKEFTDAIHAAGMKVGVYLSPRDQHYPSTSATYETYFRNLITELLTGYGPVDELEIEGDNAPDSIDWAGIAQLAKTLQPSILVWMGPEIATTGVDLRWIGDGGGKASGSTSSIADVPNGGPSGAWYPAEVHVSDRSPNWFWHAGDAVISLKSLQTLYFNSVGFNTTLRFNVPPSNTGQFDATDVTLLHDFATWYAALYKTNLVKGQSVTADSTWPAPGFEASKALDDDLSTYWAASGGVRSGRLEVSFATAIAFTVISIREPIELGERSTAYHLEFKQNGTWNQAPADASGAPIQGTVIGQRQLWQLDSTTAEAVALVIDSAKDVPAIAEFGLY